MASADEEEEPSEEEQENHASAKESRKYVGWAEAFTIFAKYAEGDIDGVCAEHDEVYAGPSPSVVSDEDKRRLEALGWRENRNDCFSKFT